MPRSIFLSITLALVAVGLIGCRSTSAARESWLPSLGRSQSRSELAQHSSAASPKRRPVDEETASTPRSKPVVDDLQDSDHEDSPVARKIRSVGYRNDDSSVPEDALAEGPATVSPRIGQSEPHRSELRKPDTRDLPPSILTEDAPDSIPPQQITLAAVLETIDRENPTVNFTRYRINEAYAQWQRAKVLWLPSLRAGVNYNKHEGRIQDVVGQNIETSRGAFYTGLGAGAVGAASPAVPGIYANFHLTDAIFQPKIAAWVNAARQANSRAVTNDLMLQSAQAYWDLLRAEQERVIAQQILSLTERLSDLTMSYADTGQGLASDADRVRTERFLRKNDLTRAEEGIIVASARLSQLLSGDPTVTLQPLEPAIVPVELVASQTSIHELVAQGLVNRPEVQESHALVCEAVQRLERERKAPLIPSLLLGVSYGGFGAGVGGQLNGFADRLDGDAVAYWEVRQLGLGERAARNEAGARVDQSRMRQIAQMDVIAREIVETHAQVRARSKQIDVARQAITVAQASYDKNIERILNAQGLPLESLQSIQALGQAQREYLRAVVDYNQAQFALHRALGWPAEHEFTH